MSQRSPFLEALERKRAVPSRTPSSWSIFESMIDKTFVAIYDCHTQSYPEVGPFHPDTLYPEYTFGVDCIGPPNPVYAGVRSLLLSLGLDTASFGTPHWNPLGTLVGPGGTAIIKPNLVISEHPLGTPGINASVAHGSVLRPLIDYLFIAMKGKGRIIVADSPIKEVDFDRIMELSGVLSVKSFYDGRTENGLELLDFRDLQVVRDSAGFMAGSRPLPGDPQGYTEIDLGADSMFHDVAHHSHLMRSTAVYYENVMDQYHNKEHNIYSVPNTLLAADVVISVAKLKTHRKGGITMGLKNSVGITNEKRSLPHHRVGPPSRGGDAIADGARWDAALEDRFRDLALSHPAGKMALKMVGRPLKSLSRQVIRPLMGRLTKSEGHLAVTEGDWYGNDTVWRMALDLIRVLVFAKAGGGLSESPQRNYLSIIDGVVAGEGEGPLNPDPKECGVIIGGFHPVTTDLAAATIMGFDYNKIPMLREALVRDWSLNPHIGLQEIEVRSNHPAWESIMKGDEPPFNFRPSAGWVGHIER